MTLDAPIYVEFEVINDTGGIAEATLPREPDWLTGARVIRAVADGEVVPQPKVGPWTVRWRKSLRLGIDDWKMVSHLTLSYWVYDESDLERLAADLEHLIHQPREGAGQP